MHRHLPRTHRGRSGCGKVTDAFLEYADRTDSDIVVHALAVNTAKADLLSVTDGDPESLF